MGKHYLIDYEYLVDEKSLHATMGHLLVFNPSQDDADVRLTFYFEEEPPKSIQVSVPAGVSKETNYANWPVQPGMRFALEVDSTIPVACQSTVGWNNSGNDYSPTAATRSPHGVRETAKSYMSITKLAKDWYLPDGIVIDGVDMCYIRESEWAVMLNPGEQTANVTMNMCMATRQRHVVQVPAKRLGVVYMDDVVKRNAHYGVHFHSNSPIAVQWLRAVNWYDKPELMAFWSVAPATELV